MWETIKKNPLLFLISILVICFFIYAILSASGSKEVENWFNSPLSKLTKGDIIIFILCFGLWTRK